MDLTNLIAFIGIYALTGFFIVFQLDEHDIELEEKLGRSWLLWPLILVVFLFLWFSVPLWEITVDIYKKLKR